uniref:Uncharacterized protein n=1 Tax=Oryza sativa subsp. japonica TaxID=39947 RepID=Q10F31_ORYSJ|nr:hypothetical protein LOC_Os03g47902 [Oryza sativa Japonica Group]
MAAGRRAEAGGCSAASLQSAALPPPLAWERMRARMAASSLSSPLSTITRGGPLLLAGLACSSAASSLCLVHDTSASTDDDYFLSDDVHDSAFLIQSSSSSVARQGSRGRENAEKERGEKSMVMGPTIPRKSVDKISQNLFREASRFRLNERRGQLREKY